MRGVAEVLSDMAPDETAAVERILARLVAVHREVLEDEGAGS